MLNLEGHPNLITGSRATAIWLNKWIFPIGQSGEASRWKVCYQRGLPRHVFIHNLRSVKVVTVLKCHQLLLPNKLSQEGLRRCVALETIDLFQSMCMSPVNAVCEAVHSGFMCLRSIEPKLSGNVLKFLEIFQPVSNLPCCLETLRSIWESSRLSGNSPDYSEIL